MFRYAWLVLPLEHFEDALVAADRGVRALAGQIDDLRGALLSVAVHPAVPLGEDHERPRHVEVDEPVAGVVEVDPLGGDIGTDQQPHRGLRVAEGFHRPLLIHVVHPAVERVQLADAEPQGRFDRRSRSQRSVSIRSVKMTSRSSGLVGRQRKGWPPRIASEEGLVLGEVGSLDAAHRLVESAEGRHFGGDRRDFAAVPFALAAGEALPDRGATGRRAGEERLFEGDDEEVPAGEIRHRAGLGGRPARASRHPDPQQRLVGRLLGRGSREPAPDDFSVAEGTPRPGPGCLS